LVPSIHFEAGGTKVILPVLKEGNDHPQKVNRYQRLRIEREANYERIWLQSEDPFPVHPVWFNRCEQFLKNHIGDGHHVVDLGCGKGEMTECLLQWGKKVDAVDISTNALKKVKAHSNLKTFREALPRTKLIDSTYDVVVALDLIGTMEEEEYRLFFSELARIGKRDSLALVSTPFDPKTEGGIERFLALFATEYELIDLEVAHLKWTFGSKLLTKIFEGMRRFLLAERGITHAIAVGRRKRML